jgi:hypothetical protein
MAITARSHVVNLAVVVSGFLVLSFPGQAKAQANDIYKVRVVSAQTAPYAAQNPHPNDIGILGPFFGVVGKVYGTPGSAGCDIGITPIPVKTKPSDLTEEIEASGSPGWPASQCYNFSYVSFGLWQEPSTADPLTAWVTSGAFTAGTPTVPTFHTAWGRVNYAPQAVGYYTKLTSVPKHPSLVIATPTASTMYVNYSTQIVYLSIEFADVSPTVSLTGQAKLGYFQGATFSKNSFEMVLSGSGLEGLAAGSLFGPTDVVPANISGTFLVKSTGLQVLGAFVGCADTRATC